MPTRSEVPGRRISGGRGLAAGSWVLDSVWRSGHFAASHLSCMLRSCTPKRDVCLVLHHNGNSIPLPPNLPTSSLKHVDVGLDQMLEYLLNCKLWSVRHSTAWFSQRHSAHPHSGSAPRVGHPKKKRAASSSKTIMVRQARTCRLLVRTRLTQR